MNNKNIQYTKVSPLLPQHHIVAIGSPANLFLFDFIHETPPAVYPTTFTANNCVMYRTFTGSDTIKTTLQALDAYIHLSCCTPSSPMRHHCQSEDTWGGTDPKTLTASDPENRGRTVYTRLLLHIFTSLALISPVLRSIPNIWHGIGNVWSAAILFHNITTNHNPADVVFTLHHQRPVATSEQAQWGVFAGFTPEYIKKKSASTSSGLYTCKAITHQPQVSCYQWQPDVEQSSSICRLVDGA